MSRVMTGAMKLAAPHPLVEIAIAPRSRADQEKLGVALARMAAEDPSFCVSTDPRSGRTIIKGMSELHLDSKLDLLERTYQVEADVGAPQVAYRETLGRRADIDYTHKRQTGGGGEFARVRLTFEPGEPGSGFRFESTVVGDNVPEAFIPGVEKGLTSAKENGLLAAFPVIDFRATLTDGAYHDLDSSAPAFEIAARAAFRQLREKGAPKLLEPIMKLEVLTPDAYMGEVIGELNARRGQVQGTQTRGAAQLVTALAPLASLFGYAAQLRAFSQGRAGFSMQYDHYGEVELPDAPGPFSPAAAIRA